MCAATAEAGVWLSRGLETVRACPAALLCAMVLLSLLLVSSAVPWLVMVVVTWLILPVVICLSQRLSHACLSMNASYCETANGSLNQL